MMRSSVLLCVVALAGCLDGPQVPPDCPEAFEVERFGIEMRCKILKANAKGNTVHEYCACPKPDGAQ
jgi:hypothetical protein